MQLSSKFKSLNYLSTLVKNNTSIGIGGHHFARLPIALINNLLNKNPKNLEFISWSGGLALELFLQKNGQLGSIWSFYLRNLGIPRI